MSAAPIIIGMKGNDGWEIGDFEDTSSRIPFVPAEDQQLSRLPRVAALHKECATVLQTRRTVEGFTRQLPTPLNYPAKMAHQQFQF